MCSVSSCCAGHSSCKVTPESSQYTHIVANMRKAGSCDSENVRATKPKATTALTSREIQPADEQADKSGQQARHAEHSRKKHKSDRRDPHKPTGAEKAAQVQAKATDYVEQLAAPEVQVAKHGTLAVAEKRQADYNKLKPWADTAGDINPENGAPRATGHQSRDSAYKHSVEARRLPGRQTPPADANPDGNQSPRGQLHEDVHDINDHSDVSNTPGSQPSPLHEEPLDADTNDSTDGKSAVEQQQAQDGASAARLLRSTSDMSSEIDECNQHTKTKQAREGERKKREGSKAADPSEAVQDRLYEEQTQQIHPQNDSEEAKRCILLAIKHVLHHMTNIVCLVFKHVLHHLTSIACLAFKQCRSF